MPVRYSAAALRDLKKMPPRDASAITDKLEIFAAAGAGDVKKLVGSDVYRLRHGDWRALFEIENGVVVLRVLNRKDAYR